MKQLWAGGWVHVQGDYFDAEDVRLYDVPPDGLDVVVAVSGDESLDVAAAAGATGIMATEPDAELVSGWGDRDGDLSSTWSEIPVAWAPTDEEGLRLAHERFRFSALGWKVNSELPNPVNFDRATAHVRPDDLASAIPHGPDPERYVTAIRQFADAGFEHLALIPVGDDVAGTLDFIDREVRPLLAD